MEGNGIRKRGIVTPIGKIRNQRIKKPHLGKTLIKRFDQPKSAFYLYPIPIDLQSQLPPLPHIFLYIHSRL
jgi:hypothetical protein